MPSSLLETWVEQVVHRREMPELRAVRVNVGNVAVQTLLPRQMVRNARVEAGVDAVKWWAEDDEVRSRVELRVVPMPYEFSVSDYLDAWASRLAWERLDRAPDPGEGVREAWDLYRTAAGRIRQVRVFRNGHALHVLGFEHVEGDRVASEHATLAMMGFQSSGSDDPPDVKALEHRWASGKWGYSAVLALRHVSPATDEPEVAALRSGGLDDGQASGAAWRLDNAGAWTGFVMATLEPQAGLSAEDWIDRSVQATSGLCDLLEGSVIQSSPASSPFRVAWYQAPGRFRGQPVWCAWLARVRDGLVFRAGMFSPALMTDPVLWTANLWIWQRLCAGTFVEPPEVVAARLERESALGQPEPGEGQTQFLRRLGEGDTLRFRRPGPSGPAARPRPEPGQTSRFQRPPLRPMDPYPAVEPDQGTQIERFRRPGRSESPDGE